MDLQAAESAPTGATIRIHATGKGGASWAPFVDPTFDYSGFGPWEAWQYLKCGELPDGSVGAYPTGDWIAWNRETGMQMGFTDKALMTAREQARTLCQIENGQLQPTKEQLEKSAPISEWLINPLAKHTREVVSMPG